MPKQDKPNILIIRGDDTGWFNVSAGAAKEQTWKNRQPSNSPARWRAEERREL